MATVLCTKCGQKVSTTEAACPHCGTAVMKLGRYVRTFIVGVLAFSVIAVAAFVTVVSEPRDDSLTSAKKLEGPTAETPAQRCSDQRAALIERAKVLEAAKDYWTAQMTLEECANALGDPELKQLALRYEASNLRATASNNESLPRQRIQAIDRLAELQPSSKAEFQRLRTSLEQQDAARDAEFKRKYAELRRQRGVSIGMTQEDAIASSWGKPKSINRTTTAHGVHEQWVYPGGYLYFEDGVLTAIQN